MHPYPTWTKHFKRVWPSVVGGGFLHQPWRWLNNVDNNSRDPSLLIHFVSFFSLRGRRQHNLHVVHLIFIHPASPHAFSVNMEKGMLQITTQISFHFSLPLPRTVLLKKLDAECVEFFPANGDAAKQKCCLAAESFRLIWCIMRSDGSTVSDVMLDMFHRGGYKQIGKQTKKIKWVSACMGQ